MRAAAILLLWLCTALPAAADQRDPRLEILFDALLEAPPDTAGRVETEIWRVWLESDDAGAFGLMQIGMIAMGAGDLDLAREAFDTLVARAPDYAEAWNKRATLRYLAGDLEGSLADIGRTLALEPRHFGALSGAGLVFDALGSEAAALGAYREALAVHPNLGHARERVRALEEAIAGQAL